MSVKVLLSCITLVSLLFSSVVKSEAMSRKQYAEMFPLENKTSANWPNVKQCLVSWGDGHPFRDYQDIRFRVIDTNVRLFGLGNTFSDHVKTSYPQIILIRPAVSVMSKTTFELMNPNGWYCFKGSVTVLGKSIIKMACDARLGSTTGNTAVLGKSQGQSGTTVMGKTVVKRVCD